MRAIQITSQNEMEIVQVPIPEPLFGEVLLKINYVGFCGSDLNTFNGCNPMVRMPVVPGHEIGATVERIALGVPESIKKGMVVTVNPYTSCGCCSSCRSGRVNACTYNETFGVQRSGAMCDYIAVPWEKIIPTPGLSPRDSALVEPMSVGFHAVSRAKVTDSDIVMVIGCGMIGVGAIVRASERGATVIAVDLDDSKLSLANELGASYTINSNTENLHSRLIDITEGYGPDVVIEAVGSPGTYRCAINEVAFAGRVVFIGYSKLEVAFQTKLFVQKELDILGSRNALPEDFRAVIKYLRLGKCNSEKLISVVVTPSGAYEAMREWAAAPAKVFRILVDFN